MVINKASLSTSAAAMWRRVPRRVLPLALLSVGAIVIASCGTQVASTTTKAPSTSVSHGAATITISNFAYSPAALTVAPGTKVTVHNADTATHSVTADLPSNGGAPPFNTGNISPSHTAYFVAPNKPGVYNYTCDIHSFMHGMLIVK